MGGGTWGTGQGDRNRIEGRTGGRTGDRIEGLGTRGTQDQGQDRGTGLVAGPRAA